MKTGDGGYSVRTTLCGFCGQPKGYGCKCDLPDRLIASTLFGKVLTNDLDNPQWDPRGVHDWRDHVPAVVQKAWPDLSAESRAVAFVFAQDAADREEWD